MFPSFCNASDNNSSAMIKSSAFSCSFADRSSDATVCRARCCRPRTRDWIAVAASSASLAFSSAYNRRRSSTRAVAPRRRWCAWMRTAAPFLVSRTCCTRLWAVLVRYNACTLVAACVLSTIRASSASILASVSAHRGSSTRDPSNGAAPTSSASAHAAIAAWPFQSAPLQSPISINTVMWRLGRFSRRIVNVCARSLSSSVEPSTRCSAVG